MSAVGGSVETVNINGRDFAPSSDTDVQMKLGGFETETQANGNGTGRKIKTRVPWSISGLTVECDEQNEDLEFLQAIANNNTFVAITITYASGEVYQGTGTVSGELQRSSQTATTALELTGTGALTKQ